MLGLASELTEPEARKKLDAIVEKVNAQGGYVRHFGLRGELKTVLRPSPLTEQKLSRPMGAIRGSIGAVSELLVCADLLAKGIEVYRAANPQAHCDLLCLVGDSHVRVEVKTVPEGTTGTAAVNLSRQAGAYDVLALVHKDGRIEYNGAIECADEKSVPVESRDRIV